jgi:HPt (histidine-containing phosphotransfer) domain-containing protein
LSAHVRDSRKRLKFSIKVTELELMPIDPNIIDPAALERLQEWGGPKLSNEIVRLFLEHGPTRMDQIRTAVDGDALDVPERGAHSLKSSAANVGAVHVQEAASQLELAASGGDLEGFRGLISSLEEAYAQAARELEMVVEEVTE